MSIRLLETNKFANLNNLFYIKKLVVSIKKRIVGNSVKSISKIAKLGF